MQLQEIIDNPKTLIACSHSGGKDSQAMYLFLKNVVPAERLVVIHADLGIVEWSGTLQHIKDTVDSPIYVVKNPNKDFFQMVEHRKMFPSPKNRQCTSDLKRAPIRVAIRKICNENGYNIVLDCMGLRAQESSGRAKKKAFVKLNSQCNSKRDWYQWLPIHDWTEEAVFSYIADNAQKPHWAYGAGMSRLSCSFCIMSSDADLKIAAKLRPDLLERYSELEERLGHTFIMPSKSKGKRTLKEIVNS